MSLAWHEIRDHLMHSSSTLRFFRSFDSIRLSQKSLTAFRDPAALLDGLRSGPGDPAEKNLVLSALIKAAQGDGSSSDCAMTVLLLALWPGLDAIRRRSIRRKLGPADELASDLLARATEAVRCLDMNRVNWVAATVLRNVERDMIRSYQREAERQGATSDVDPDEIPATQAQPDRALQFAHLADDMRRMIGGDAPLVIRVAIEGFSHSEVAIQLGVSEAAARKRYQRATQRLRDRFREIV